MNTSTTLFDKIFRDENGRVVIAQAPNLPLILWFIISIFRFLPISSELDTGLDWLAFTVLLVWAWQEIFSGVNYFRRGLGLSVLIIMTFSRIPLVFPR